jgi:hypothetical protein
VAIKSLPTIVLWLLSASTKSGLVTYFTPRLLFISVRLDHRTAEQCATWRVVLTMMILSRHACGVWPNCLRFSATLSPCLKSVDTRVVLANFVCRFTLNASVRAVSGYRYLTGSDFSKRWYHQLPYLKDVPIPVRVSVQQTCGERMHGT